MRNLVGGKGIKSSTGEEILYSFCLGVCLLVFALFLRWSGCVPMSDLELIVIYLLLPLLGLKAVCDHWPYII